MSAFDEIDSLLAVNSTTGIVRSGEERRWIEDRWAVQDILLTRYEKLGFAKPRFVWAASPAAIYGAIEMLRQVQAGQTNNLVTAMVPMADPVETSTRRTALTALIDPGITVTMGAATGKQIRAISQVSWLNARANQVYNILFTPQNLLRRIGPAQWEDAVVYSDQCGFGRFGDQLYCMLPYMKVVWLCQPGELIGSTLRFQDGFHIDLNPEVPLQKQLAEVRSRSRLELPWGTE